MGQSLLLKAPITNRIMASSRRTSAATRYYIHETSAQFESVECEILLSGISSVCTHAGNVGRPLDALLCIFSPQIKP